MRRRILITGSRNWTDRELLHFVLGLWLLRAGLPGDAVLVSGACPTGADQIAEEFWAFKKLPIERHPADWGAHGKQAGFLRNVEMVQTRPEHCFAFILNRSKGATHTAEQAEMTGVPTTRIEIRHG